MHWDLLEEHKEAYDAVVCKKIDELTNLFDIILDDIKLYPSMMCVDVFPCIENIAIEIPKHIKTYYKGFLDEEYKDKMQRKFDLSLDLEKKETGSIYEALNTIFNAESLFGICTSRPVDQSENIKKVADRLSEEVGTTFAECFFVSKHDLNLLQELYIGILYFGWVLRCGNYGILILLGTNE